MQKSNYIFFALLILILSSCGKEENPEKIYSLFFGEDEVLITIDASNITSNSAKSGANFDFFSSDIFEKGLCWGTEPQPDLSDKSVKLGSGNDNFEYTITGLKSETLYYVRAFATTASDTIYGYEISFTTTETLPIDYTQYNSIPDTLRERYYTCDFSEPTSIWPTYNSEPNWFYAIYSSLGYEIRNNYSSSRLISGAIEDISQYDFEIEYVFQRIYRPSFNSVSFVWGLKNTDPMKFYYLRLSSRYDLSVNIGSYDNEEIVWLNQTNFDDFNFNQYGDNKFTIRKIDSKYYFFINEVFLYERSAESFFGSRIGIAVGGPSESIFKNLKIDYIHSSNKRK